MIGKFIIPIVCSMAVFGQDPPDIEAMKKGQPKDVANFISRAFGCWHFGGEEAYSKERAAEIRAAVKKLRCDLLKRDEAKLRKKYKSVPSVIKALDAAQSF